MKRNVLFSIFCSILMTGVLLTASFKYDDKISTAAVTKASKQVITANQIGLVKKNPNTYKGYPIQITARVVTAKVAGQKGYTTFQALLDPQGQKVNSIISIKGSTVVKNGQNIKLQGIITGQKAGDAKLKLVRITASKIEKVSAINPAAPAVTTIIPVGTAIQQGVEISVPKIELTRGETRIYLKIKNGSSSMVIFDYSKAKLIQGAKEYNQQSSNGSVFLPPQGDLLPGIETQGSLVFGPADYTSGSIKLYLEKQSKGDLTPMYISVSWSRDGKSEVSCEEEKPPATTSDLKTETKPGLKSMEELKKQAVPMGRTFTTDEELEITVSSMLQGSNAEALLTGRFSESSNSGSKLTVISLSVKNVSSKQQSVSISRDDFALTGSSGKIIKPLTNTKVPTNPSIKPLADSLQQGEAVVGAVDFYVPEDENRLYLIWDPDHGGKNQKYFEVH
ncbi:MAG: DUF4352 domain-containing protein [Chitinophagales bacterium]